MSCSQPRLSTAAAHLHTQGADTGECCVPVNASGRLMPLSAIQSISRSHRSQSHLLMQHGLSARCASRLWHQACDGV
jgi:hypothetical protein